MKTLIEMCKGYGIQGAWTIALSVLTYLVHKKLKKHEEIVEKSKKKQENIEIGLQSLLTLDLQSRLRCISVKAISHFKPIKIWSIFLLHILI